MDTKIKVLAFALFLVLLLVPFWVASVVLQGGRESSDDQLNRSAAPRNRETLADRSSARDTNQSGQLVRQAKLEEATRRISSLEALLDKQDKLLASRDVLIKEKEAQCLQLKDELDQYLAALVQVVADDPVDDPGGAAATTTEATDLRTQMDDLKAKLTRATAAENVSQTEIAELNQQLLAANRKLALYEVAANLDRDPSLPAAALKVVARSGSAAVPALIELMSDPRANVRSWAATALGEIGPAAGDAALVLRDASSDSDARVRAAARAALIEILD